MRTSRSPTIVMTANGEVRTNKEATICQTIGLIRQSYASSRNSRGAFIGETLRRTWVHVSLEKRSRSTSHQKWLPKKFPDKHGTDKKTLGGDRRLKPSTFIRDSPDRGEEQDHLRGESNELTSPTPLQEDGSQKGFLVNYAEANCTC